MKPRLTVALALTVLASSTAALAQQPPQAPPAGTQAPPTREVTTIRRNTDHISAIGEFPREDAPRPAPRPANGEVGSTGAVAERRPETELRGSAGPAPGEIDMTHPIGPGDVARIVRAYEPRFRPCYDRARASRPALAGRVNMRFVVTRTGDLSGVEVSGIPEAPEVATCIRTELQQAHFPRPESGPLPFAYGMNFTPPAPPPRGRPRGGRPPRASH